jgi:hypothetical protein
MLIPPLVYWATASKYIYSKEYGFLSENEKIYYFIQLMRSVKFASTY